MLHGSGSSLQSFDQVALALESDFEVIRPDLAGFGLTGPRPDRDYRIATYVRTIERLMRALGITTYAVVGNSLGGNIARNLALDDQPHLDALVLINATGYPGNLCQKASGWRGIHCCDRYFADGCRGVQRRMASYQR